MPPCVRPAFPQCPGPRRSPAPGLRPPGEFHPCVATAWAVPCCSHELPAPHLHRSPPRSRGCLSGSFHLLLLPSTPGCHLSLTCDHSGARDSYRPFCCGPIRWTLYFLYLTSFSLTRLPFFASWSTQPLNVDIPEGWGLGLWRPRRSAAQSFRAGRGRHRSRLGGPAAEFQRRPCPFWE